MTTTATYPTDLKDVTIPASTDVAAAQAEIDKLTPEERKKYEEGIAKATTAADLQPALKDSAQLAAQACKNIEAMFVSLTSTLTGLDHQYTPPDAEGFTPKLGRIQTKFRETVWDSQKLALDIAHYAEKFDDLILPYCSDKDLTTEKRLKKIDQFVTEADGFSTAAGTMKSRFDGLKDDFAKFVGTFGTWAEDKEKADNEEIKKLQDDIIDLQSQLDKLDIALKTLLGTLAFTLPITGIFAIFAGPFAPLVMIAGGIIAGLELSSVVGILIAKGTIQNDINGKNNRIKVLTEEIKTLQATRVQLQDTGTKDLIIFSQNIEALGMVWQGARNDAYQVKQWLQDGAVDADTPKYMMLSVGKAVGVYRAMGQYLMGYANGVTGSDIPKN